MNVKKRLNNQSKLEDLGEILRTNSFKLSIVYGSGGYCTQITHKGRHFIAFSNDIQRSVSQAINKAIDGKSVNYDDITSKY